MYISVPRTVTTSKAVSINNQLFARQRAEAIGRYLGLIMRERDA